MIYVLQKVLLLTGLMDGTSHRRIPPRSSVKGGRIAAFGALPHARMETEDPISAETGPKLQSESEFITISSTCLTIPHSLLVNV